MVAFVYINVSLANDAISFECLGIDLYSSNFYFMCCLWCCCQDLEIISVSSGSLNLPSTCTENIYICIMLLPACIELCSGCTFTFSVNCGQSDKMYATESVPVLFCKNTDICDFKF